MNLILQAEREGVIERMGGEIFRDGVERERRCGAKGESREWGRDDRYFCIFCRILVLVFFFIYIFSAVYQWPGRCGPRSVGPRSSPSWSRAAPSSRRRGEGG